MKELRKYYVVEIEWNENDTTHDFYETYEDALGRAEAIEEFDENASASIEIALAECENVEFEFMTDVEVENFYKECKIREVADYDKDDRVDSVQTTYCDLLRYYKGMSGEQAWKKANYYEWIIIYSNNNEGYKQFMEAAAQSLNYRDLDEWEEDESEEYDEYKKEWDELEKIGGYKIQYFL